MNQKRNTLKKVAGVSAVVALAPSSWTKPIVSSIVLPAHAQTSDDTTAPQIVVDTTPITLTVGDTLMPPTATCTDDVDTTCSVTVDVSEVDTSTAGSYEIIYQSTDTAGNTVEVRVPVIVELAPDPEVVFTCGADCEMITGVIGDAVILVDTIDVFEGGTGTATINFTVSNGGIFLIGGTIVTGSFSIFDTQQASYELRRDDNSVVASGLIQGVGI